MLLYLGATSSLMNSVGDMDKWISSDFATKSKTKHPNKYLSAAVSSIIRNIFLKDHSKLNILTAVEKPRNANFVKFKDSLIPKEGLVSVRLDDHVNVGKWENNSLGLHSMILLDSFESFEKLENKIQPNIFNFRGNFLFVLLNGKIDFVRIFFRMVRKKITNVNVIYEDEENVKVMSFMLFARKMCEKPKTIEVAIYSGKNKSFNVPYEKLFPEKLSNFHECPIKMAAVDKCPVLCIEKSQSGKSALNGFDGKIIDIIVRSLNLSLEIYVSNTSSRAINSITSNETDFTAGNLFIREDLVKTMDASDVY
jgi:hypothetical protein